MGHDNHSFIIDQPSGISSLDSNSTMVYDHIPYMAQSFMPDMLQGIVTAPLVSIVYPHQSANYDFDPGAAGGFFALHGSGSKGLESHWVLSTNGIPYGGQDINLYAYFQRSLIATGDVHLKMSYKFAELGQSPSSTPDVIFNNIFLDMSLYEEEISEVLLTTMDDGTASDILLGLRVMREASGVLDTYLDTFKLLGYRLEVL